MTFTILNLDSPDSPPLLITTEPVKVLSSGDALAMKFVVRLRNGSHMGKVIRFVSTGTFLMDFFNALNEVYKEFRSKNDNVKVLAFDSGRKLERSTGGKPGFNIPNTPAIARQTSSKATNDIPIIKNREKIVQKMNHHSFLHKTTDRRKSVIPSAPYTPHNNTKRKVTSNSLPAPKKNKLYEEQEDVGQVVLNSDDDDEEDIEECAIDPVASFNTITSQSQYQKKRFFKKGDIDIASATSKTYGDYNKAKLFQVQNQHESATQTALWDSMTVSNCVRNGFRNLGQSCYIGSILQLLINIPVFYKSLMDDEDYQKEMKLCNGVTWELMRLFDDKRKNSVSSPGRLKKIIGERNNQFAENTQQDAHEFFTELCHLVEIEAEFLSTNNNKSDTQIQENPNQLLSPKSAIKKKEKQNPVQDNFEYKIRQTLHCCSCGGVTSEVVEVYRDLSLNFPEAVEGNKVELKSMINDFFSDEIIDHSCPYCAHAHAKKSTRIQQFPKILLIHLKRFASSFTKNEQTGEVKVVYNKRREMVEFNGALKISSTGFYDGLKAVEEEVFPDIITDQENQSPSKKTVAASILETSLFQEYELNAFVNHLGNNISRGHYTCNAYVGGDLNKWVCYDDSTRSIQQDDLFEKRGDTVYMLGYVRKN